MPPGALVAVTLFFKEVKRGFTDPVRHGRRAVGALAAVLKTMVQEEGVHLGRPSGNVPGRSSAKLRLFRSAN